MTDSSNRYVSMDLNVSDKAQLGVLMRATSCIGHNHYIVSRAVLSDVQFSFIIILIDPHCTKLNGNLRGLEPVCGHYLYRL